MEKIMLLTVSGLNAAPIRFKHLCGRYVLSFKPWNHCLACLETKIANPVTPQMKDGEYPLSDDHGLFYLCGVGKPDLPPWSTSGKSVPLPSPTDQVDLPSKTLCRFFSP
jgi:hypothetical protein